jgi:hypothetical protein
MVYRFYLKANPSAKIFFFNSDISERELQIKWLESEAEINGFQLLTCSVTQDGYITCREDKIKFISAIFEGSVKITVEDKFTKMLHNGIGRGKEYGLGLFSVESYGCKNRNIAGEMKNSSGNLSN